jgi:putative transposase
VATGEKVSRQRVARLMRGAGIESKMSKRFVITTHSRNTLAPAPDRLQRGFSVDRENKAWVSDTTFIRTRQGWLFLAVMLDLYFRKIIGWSMSDRNDKRLIVDALTMATQHRAPREPVIVHSDQGSTYASSEYQQRLKEQGLLCSMSRKGECHDNAVAESFFGTLKTELVDHEDYYTRLEAKRSVFNYIEVFYNRQRRHSYLGYVRPVEYERANAGP